MRYFSFYTKKIKSSNNIDSKTSFSFLMPPLPDRINYADIADKLNK